MIGICEDDTKEFEKLLAILYTLNAPFKHEYFSDGASFLAEFHAGKYDLIFMDIYMEGLNGVETISEVRKIDRIVPIAFMTTSPEHALDGYRYHVNRYLLKPLQPKEVMEVIMLASTVQENAPGVILHIDGDYANVPFNRIRYAEQDGRTICLFLTGGRILRSPGKLDSFEKSLPSPPFFRCHKSFIVNLSHIKRLDRELCGFEMNNGGFVHIRRSSLKASSEAFESYMFDKTRE